MPPRSNLADPDYEPTDEDLAELMHEAFAGPREAREESDRTRAERIARLQAEALARLDALRRGASGG